DAADGAATRHSSCAWRSSAPSWRFRRGPARRRGKPTTTGAAWNARTGAYRDRGAARPLDVQGIADYPNVVVFESPARTVRIVISSGSVGISALGGACRIADAAWQDGSA